METLSADEGDAPQELQFSGLAMRRVRHPGFDTQLGTSQHLGCDGNPMIVSPVVMMWSGCNSDPTGSSVYDAALCLCWWLESESGRAMVPLAGRVVVELGAGTGVVGLAATRLGAHCVWMTDGEPPSVSMCLANLAIEAVTDAAKRVRARSLGEHDGLCGGAEQLLWGSTSGLQLGRLLRSFSAPKHKENGGGGVVLAADVVYEMAAVEPLVESIEAAFREGFAAACVVSYESRAHKLDEVRTYITVAITHANATVRACILIMSLCAALLGSMQEAAFLEAVRARFDTQVLVAESWGSWGGAPRPWWWFEELSIVLITAEAC
jgi:predicted nicotinamide N-methyase